MVHAGKRAQRGLKCRGFQNVAVIEALTELVMQWNADLRPAGPATSRRCARNRRRDACGPAGETPAFRKRGAA